MPTPPFSNDQCERCNTAYTLIKRKKNCIVCRQSFCPNCAPRERHYPCRVCLICQLISSESSTQEQLLAVKVKHLRSYLQAKNIPNHTCTEKQELVDLIVRSRHLPFHYLQQQAAQNNSTNSNNNYFTTQTTIPPNQQFQTNYFNTTSFSTSASSSSSSSTASNMPPPPPPPKQTNSNPSHPFTNFQHTMSSFASQMNHFAANLQDYVSSTVSGVLHHALHPQHPEANNTNTNHTSTPNSGNTSSFNFGTTMNAPGFASYTFSSPGSFVYTSSTNGNQQTPPSDNAQYQQPPPQQNRRSNPQPNRHRQGTSSSTTNLHNPDQRTANNMHHNSQSTPTNLQASNNSNQNVEGATAQPPPQRIRRKSLSDIKDDQNIEDLSIKELKEILATNFVNYKGCVEKSELIEKVQRLYRDRTSQQEKAKELDGMSTGDTELCKVCMDSTVECVFLDCGHMVTCVKCGKLLAECPICRQNIIRVVRLDNVGNLSWIQRSFKKRECVKFIPVLSQPDHCHCGKAYYLHDEQHVSSNHNFLSTNEKWSTQRNTEVYPTDAYGTIEFEGQQHPTKAQYVRLAHDTRPDLILKLFIKEWNLKLPRLVISIDGGIANFELQPKLKRVLKKGLFRAAKTTGAWIITNGTNTGVVKHVGDALFVKSPKVKSDIVVIGFAPWGVVEGRETFIGANKLVSYHSMTTPTKNCATLNSNHYYFLLVDNGTTGKFGGEVVLRKKFERFLSRQRSMNIPGHAKLSNIPVVCVVVEGGTNTIRMVLENVTNIPSVPVVVCDGSGRAADLIAFTHRYARDDGTMPLEIQEQLIQTIIKTFGYTREQAQNLFLELMLCVKRKDLITVFRMGEESQDIDLAILTALLRSQGSSHFDQLTLALHWNRVDIARSYFHHGHQWVENELYQIMMSALVTDKVEFVQLLLENGIYMQKFLTISRLEELYNTKEGPPNTIHFIMKDIRKLRKTVSLGRYTLPDIGLVIEKLMGHGYRSNYTRRRFRHRYVSLNEKLKVKRTKSDIDDTFPYPYNELLLWTVLMKRHQMAIFMWQRGEEAMAKALVATRLNKSLSKEADDDELEVEVSAELGNYAEQFRQLALGILEQCYKDNADKTCQLLTYELKNWSDWTCLSLAVIAHHQEFVAHKCCQMLLNDLWMGGMSIRRYSFIYVIGAILFPPLVFRIEFKTPEELQQMPKTAEEHLATHEDGEISDNDEDDEKEDNENLMVFEPPQPQQSVQEIPIDRSLLQQSQNGEFDSLIQLTSSRIAQYKNTLDSTNIAATNIVADTHSHHISVVPQSSLTTFLTPKQQQPRQKQTSLSWIRRFILNLSNRNKNNHDINQFQSTIDETAGGERVRKRTLSIKERFYEFYNAPITKFWQNALFFLLFLLLFTYTVLVRTPAKPSIPEILVTIYLGTFALDTTREILFTTSPHFIRKLTLYFSDFIHIFDTLALLAYGIGFALRFHPRTIHIGRLFYCLNVSYWYLHLLNYIGVNKTVGPYINIAAQNLIDLFNFIIIILVVLMSFGVSRQAIRYPNRSWTWDSVKQIFIEPYFMIYGEVYADTIDPPCTDEKSSEPECQPGFWITPITMTVFLIFCNILLLSILIATFNNTYLRISKQSDQLWKYQRYFIVLKYEAKPMLAPPLIFISHILFILKLIYRCCRSKKLKFDHGLKLFLTEKEVFDIHDFEEENMDEYFVIKDKLLRNTTEEQVAVTAERVDSIALRTDDIYQRETHNKIVLQNLDWRLQRLEELNLQIFDTVQTIASGSSFPHKTTFQSPFVKDDCRRSFALKSPVVRRDQHDIAVQYKSKNYNFETSAENIPIPRISLHGSHGIISHHFDSKLITDNDELSQYHSQLRKIKRRSSLSPPLCVRSHPISNFTFESNEPSTIRPRLEPISKKTNYNIHEKMINSPSLHNIPLSSITSLPSFQMRQKNLPQLLTVPKNQSSKGISLMKKSSTIIDGQMKHSDEQSLENAFKILNVKQLTSNVEQNENYYHDSDVAYISTVGVKINEYTSITDSIDTSMYDRSTSPIQYSSSLTSEEMKQLRSEKTMTKKNNNAQDDDMLHSAEESTHNLIGQFIKKRVRKLSITNVNNHSNIEQTIYQQRRHSLSDSKNNTEITISLLNIPSDLNISSSSIDDMVFAALFCILSISTNRWYTTSTIQAGLWKICRTSPGIPTLCYSSLNRTSAIFALSGLILIFIGLILTIVLTLFGLERPEQKRNISCLTTIVLLLGSISLGISYVSYSNIQRQFGYSYFFMIISQVFTFLATTLTAFSVGRIIPVA
ncbi:unnamed protein product [Didymodactylos carnosus]|uniref:RING-type domain-containing protein n=1 Tax=Didymodactylos carnosus TaxID=1234261 RepID=A0A813NE45_9BILA|nr:unnamed protein product [Didymodactylos carnosus]CAF3515338.1 unnamed protein product [Didymodactylos carnosus]